MDKGKEFFFFFFFMWTKIYVKLRKANWETTSQLRDKYDQAMKEMEASAEEEDQSSRAEVSRLGRTVIRAGADGYTGWTGIAKVKSIGHSWSLRANTGGTH